LPGAVEEPAEFRRSNDPHIVSLRVENRRGAMSFLATRQFHFVGL